MQALRLMAKYCTLLALYRQLIALTFLPVVLGHGIEVHIWCHVGAFKNTYT